MTLFTGLTLFCLIVALLIGRELFQRAGEAVSWAWVFDEIERSWPDVPQMSVDELSRRLALSGLAERPVLIDVRQRSEYEISHLPGAMNAESPDDISALVGELPPGRQVVLYCSVGIRSSEAADRLRAGGRTNVFNLQGSIFEWANAGHPVVSNGLPTDKVHPYDEEWGQLLNASLRPGAHSGF